MHFLQYPIDKYDALPYDEIMTVLEDLKVIMGKKKPVETPKSTEPPKKVLIVEDEPIILEMYKDKLVKEGYDVVTAENGEKGLEAVIQEKPNIILLDLMMPVMDGKTMLRRVRVFPQFKRLPVIVLTNAGEIDNIKETQKYDKAVEFLIKSNVSLDEIVDKVKFWDNAFI